MVKRFKNTRLCLITILLFFLASSSNYAQSFLKTQGQSIVDEDNNPIILRGMGLGGWMVQEAYMLQTAEFANPQHEIRQKITEVIGEEATQEFL